MLHFFRRHQKVIFIGTTVVVVSSFVFFGTYNTLGAGAPRHKEIELVKLIDGTSLTQSRAVLMSRFLSFSAEDARSVGPANFFNDGVLEKDILSGPFARMILSEYEDSLREDFTQRVKTISEYVPYVHPLDLSISEEKLLSNFEPSLLDVLARAKKGGALSTSEAFSLVSDGYVKTRKMPYDMIKRVLLYQQQANGLQQDISLDARRLGVFSLTSAESWLGKSFIDLSAQLICNGAALARKKGYRVTKAEALSSLTNNLRRNLERDPRHKITDGDVKDSFYQQLAALGMDEARCIELWQDVLLFRKLTNPVIEDYSTVSKGVEQKIELAKQVRLIDLYEVPSVLRGADFYSMLKLQLYIDHITPSRSRNDILLFPKETLPLAEIEKKAPELVQKRYVLDYAEVKKRDVIASIPLKDLWQWQIEDKNWPFVTSQIAALSKQSSTPRSDRFALIEGLSDKDRQALDLITGQKIFEAKPDLLKAALLSVERKTKEVGLSEKVSHPLFAISNTAYLMSFLDKAPLGDEKDLSAEAIAAQQKLMSYSEDGEHFYSIAVKRRDDKKRLLTFDQAKKEGVIDKMFAARLEDVYSEARRKEPARFQRSNGSYKTALEVQDILAKYAFADLLRAIEQSYAAYFGMQPQPQQTSSLSFYVTYRPLSFLLSAKEHLEIDAEDIRWSYGATSGYQRDLDKQWLLVRSRREIPLSDTSLFLSGKALEIDVGNLSSAVTLKNGSLALVKMVAKEVREKPSEEEMKKIKAMAASERACEIAHGLMLEIKEKRAIKPIASYEGVL